MKLHGLNYSVDADQVIGGFTGRINTKLELTAIADPETMKKFMEGKHKLQVVLTVDGAMVVEAYYREGVAVITGDNVSIKAEIIE